MNDARLNLEQEARLWELISVIHEHYQAEEDKRLLDVYDRRRIKFNGGWGTAQEKSKTAL